MEEHLAGLELIVHFEEVNNLIHNIASYAYLDNSEGVSRGN
jgi:hypothetical protein